VATDFAANVLSSGDIRDPYPRAKLPREAIRHGRATTSRWAWPDSPALRSVVITTRSDSTFRDAQRPQWEGFVEALDRNTLKGLAKGPILGSVCRAGATYEAARPANARHVITGDANEPAGAPWARMSASSDHGGCSSYRAYAVWAYAVPA
jgi:hypothetical protein